MADATPPQPPSDPVEVMGNRLRLLPGGAERLEALIGLIDSARESLRLLFYIFKDDRCGARVRDALLAACARGVKVTLLVDGFGCQDVAPGFFQPLVHSACRFCHFEPRWGRRYLLRNHQKLALADGTRAIAGGFNISDDYFDAAPAAWRDLGFSAEGPAVEALTAYFDDLYAWSIRPKARLRELRHLIDDYSQREGALRWLLGGPTRRLSPWAQSVKRDMMKASRVDLVAAYFAPSRSMLRRIEAVAGRGKARLVTAAKSDNGATIGAARHTYARLLRRGVEVYEYQPTKLHTKLIVIDDVVHIGSANFDMRSLYLNLEVVLRVEDAAFAAEARRYVEAEIAHSREITPAIHQREGSWLKRLTWGLAYFVVVSMDYNVSRRLNFGIDGR
jgi:cardiolipin synthase